MAPCASEEIRSFAIEFRDGLIGTQPKASLYMCKLVTMPLRAALKVLRGIDTDLVTEDGHTFLVTTDRQYRIDPTIDQFSLSEFPQEKVLIDSQLGSTVIDESLSSLPFVELMQQLKRLNAADGKATTAKDAGAFVAKYVYYPLAQKGVFDFRA